MSINDLTVATDMKLGLVRVMKKHGARKLISVILSVVLICVMLSGCGSNAKDGESQLNTNSSYESISAISNPGIIESVVESSVQEVETQVQDEPMADDNLQLTAEKASLSWKNYIGDIDTAVYGLILREYSLLYDVFYARVQLNDGTDVFGIAYSDYADYYASNDEIGYFPAGFIRLIGEPLIPEEEIEQGLIIHPLYYRFIFVVGADPNIYLIVFYTIYLVKSMRPSKLRILIILYKL